MSRHPWSYSRFAFVGLCFATVAYGSGGWVGNSPMLAAFTPTIYQAPSVRRAESFDTATNDERAEKFAATAPRPNPTPPVVADLSEVEAPPAYNSLLLPKGARRISLGLSSRSEFQAPQHWKVGTRFSFDFGITERVSLINLTQLGVSLKSGNGVGHEWAIMGGLLGLELSARDGALLTPGLSLVHAYSRGPWRFTNALTASGVYGPQGGRKWLDRGIALRTGVSYWISENWLVGASAQSEVKQTAVLTYDCAVPNSECGVTARSNKNQTKWLIAHPAVEVSRRMDKRMLTVRAYSPERDEDLGIDVLYQWNW